MPEENENGIKLREFVSNAISEVVRGVADAQSAVRETGAIVNPVYTEHELLTGATLTHRPLEQLTLLEFDVAVTVTGRTEGAGSIGGFISVIGAGYRRSTHAEHSEVSRIKFAVRMLLPDGFPE
jgi:hypothetical protein